MIFQFQLSKEYMEHFKLILKNRASLNKILLALLKSSWYYCWNFLISSTYFHSILNDVIPDEKYDKACLYVKLHQIWYLNASESVVSFYFATVIFRHNDLLVTNCEPILFLSYSMATIMLKLSVSCLVLTSYTNTALLRAGYTSEVTMERWAYEKNVLHNIMSGMLHGQTPFRPALMWTGSMYNKLLSK